MTYHQQNTKIHHQQNRDNSATFPSGETWMMIPYGPWLGQRDSRWQDLAGVAWLGASAGCWLSPKHGGPLKGSPWDGIFRFLFEKMDVFGFLSDFSGFWDEFWKCFHGMTMSLELVDVMESSPVATMNNSIFWWILVEPYWNEMPWFDGVRFTWGSPNFFAHRIGIQRCGEWCGLYFVGKFQEFCPKFVQIQYHSFSLCFWIKLFQVKIYWKNIDHIWAIYIILTIYLFQNEWICIYICIYTY